MLVDWCVMSCPLVADCNMLLIPTRRLQKKSRGYGADSLLSGIQTGTVCMSVPIGKGL